MKRKNESLGIKSLKYICKVSVLTALATVLYVWGELPFPIFAPFYKFDFSSVIAMTGSFALGPLAGIIITIIKNIIKIIASPSSQNIVPYIGEYIDVMISIIFIFPATIIYQSKKTKKNAIIGLAVGSVAMTVCASLLNYYLLIPIYASMGGMDINTIVSLTSEINKYVKDLPSLIIWATVPFNLLKSFICSLITFLLYKRVSKILHI